MGDKRAIIAIIVAFLALFLYGMIRPALVGPESPPTPPAPQQPAPPQSVPPAKPRVTVPLPGTRPAATAPATQPAQTAPVIEPLQEPQLEEEITVKTALFQVVLTNRGAAVRSVTLQDFFTFPDHKSPPLETDPHLRLITEIEPGKASLTIAEAAGAGDLDKRTWEHVKPLDVRMPEGYTAATYSAVEQFRTRAPELGVEITKTFLFHEPEYPRGLQHPVGGRDFEVVVSVENLGNAAAAFQYRIASAAGMVPEPTIPPMYPLEQQPSQDLAAVVGILSGESVGLDTFSSGKASDGPYRFSTPKGQPIYAGVRDRYFVAVLEPLKGRAEIGSVLIEKVGQHNVTSVLEILPETIPAGGVSTKGYMFLVAPRSPDVLAAYQTHHFEALVEYGWPAPVTRLLAWLLQVFRQVTPNYGWAIVLLTVCVRLVLHPLTLKSQKTQHKMQKVQPLLTAAKEKYKHDKKLQQQEVMKVMREQGANPLGGCLPMLLQLPIFLGLWRALYQDASLRQAPFMMWMNDLSKPDSLFTFSGGIPWIGQSFNLLPILCAVVMIVQQKMTPMSPDPQQRQQQKILMFMPVIFTLMLYHMPSGLMVYFLASSVFGVAEQWFILRRLNRAAAAADAEGKSAVPVDVKREHKKQGKR